MKPIPFSRTFHTVGQGAFYSECLNIKGKSFTMVYDCGSDSLSKDILKKRVNSDLGNESKSGVSCDLLFISHFDRDHINGVQFLDPKTVVIPFLTKDQKILLRIYNELFGEKYDLALVESPEETFPNAQIVRIYPDGGTPNGNENLPTEENDNRPPEVYDNPNGVNISADGRVNSHLPAIIASGVPLNVENKGTLFWEYIPFNPNWTKYAARFKQKVKDEKLDWYKLSDLQDGEYFKKYFSVLKSIYNGLKPKNEHSLVVYSNSVQATIIDYELCALHDCCFCPVYEVPAGCVYFGDVTIENRWLDRFYTTLGERLKAVGIFQVPHHGSILSKGHEIFPTVYSYAAVIFCIISVGEINKHGHPSAKVIRELSSYNHKVVLVTESASTLFFGKGEI